MRDRARAQAEKSARVTHQEAVYRGRPVQVIEVEVPEPQAAGRCRNRWVLYVDPASDRILRSETRLDCQAPGGVWQTRDEEILDGFTYDPPVEDRLFEVASPGRLLRPDAR